MKVKIKTPCVGICSATSLGDKVCRGCGRYDYEVRDWIRYSEDQKRRVLERLRLSRSGGYGQRQL